MRSKIMSSFVIVLIVSLALAACSPSATLNSTGNQPVELAQGSVQINGAGSTFAVPIYSEWTYAYQYVDPSVLINYQGIGSGGGKKAIIDKTVDFAGSDSLLSSDEYSQAGDLQMYPIVAGAVVLIYNIKLNTPQSGSATSATSAVLTLDRQTLVDIYNAKITKWNDPAITALNPDLAGLLPDAAITVVHRSDGSGTTELFTKALTSFSPDWTAGGASTVQWPVDVAGNGVGGNGNPGVAAAVINTPNSIGYVELSYAISNKINYANMINKAGTMVTANMDSIVSAMNDFASSFTDKLTNTIVDGAGANSWPISGYTYMILHTQSMTDPVKAQKLLEYIRWTLTDPAAAQKAASLGYAVLPDAVRTMVLNKLSEVTVNGNPVLP